MQMLDMELTVWGYEQLKGNGVHNWVKLSVDSWLADEHVIMQILQCMHDEKCAYAGNWWYSQYQMSTDIIFANTEMHNIFEDFQMHGTAFFDHLYATKSSGGFELFMKWIAAPYNRLIIQDREPLTADGTRWCVPQLGWTMKHQLQDNVAFCNNYTPCNHQVTLKTLSGSGKPFELAPNKQHI